MILIIDTCSEPLSSREFVRPVRDILEAAGAEIRILPYPRVTPAIAAKAEKIILCGNALQDQVALANTARFAWLLTRDKPTLAICAGMQILAAVFGAPVQDSLAIGVKPLRITRADALLGEPAETPAYLLHTKRPALPSGFETIAEIDGHPAAIRHAERPLRAVLFHPEVMNKDILVRFADRP